MIKSIVPLPEFASAGTVIDGTGTNGIFNGDSFDDVPDLTKSGRKIVIDPSSYHKYKLHLTDYSVGREYTVVFITHDTLDIFNLNRNESSVIYPIYIREFPVPGAESQLKSNLILSHTGINRLFNQMQLPEVTSTTVAIRHLVNRLEMDYSVLPKYLAEDMLDMELSTLAPLGVNIAELLCNADMETIQQLESIIHYGCILKGYVSREAKYILNSAYLGSLLPLLDPAHRHNLTMMGVVESMNTWGSYYTWIHEHDDDCPRYVTESEGEMEYMLYYSTIFKTIDFKVFCPPQSQHIPNAKMFNPFSVSNLPDFSDYSMLSQFSQAVRNQVHLDFTYSEESTVTAIGSYIEDLTIYDRRDELIAYIDLVWWILANGSGLLDANKVLI